MTPDNQSQRPEHANDQALFHANEHALQSDESSLEEPKDEGGIGPTVCDTAGTCYPNDSNETGG